MREISYSYLAIGLLIFTLNINVQAQNEKALIRMDLTYHQKDNELPILEGTAKTKNGKKFQPVAGVDINFFVNEETAQGFIGRVKTNNSGIGVLKLPNRYKTSWGALPSMKFMATITSNELFEDASAEIEISKARIELSLESEDSNRMMSARLLALQDSSWVEVPDTEIKFLVRRLLTDLAAGEEELYTTDEEGEVSSAFNFKIPGDAEGNIMIAAKIEDNELYGSLVATKVVKWGVPVNLDKSFAKRTLWSTRDKTPLWLLIFPNLIIASVWAVIFYLVYQIIQIRKIGKVKQKD